jgi:2-iminobutanoate/2-iminopropanoate deaminase
MKKETCSTERAPAAIGPYSQAVRAGSLIFLSGQLPIDSGTGRLEEGSIARQTEMILGAVRDILDDAGSSIDRVVKVTVYMTDMEKFGEMNEVYARFFPVDPPARSAVGVKSLPKGAAIEIDVVALDGID